MKCGCGVIMQIKFCTENNKRLIHFSTCEVFGKTIGSFLPEEYRKVQQESICGQVHFI